MSDYVSPRAADNYPGSRSNLYLFPLVPDRPRSLRGTNIDNSGYDSTDQLTAALGPASVNGTSRISFPNLAEAGKRVNSQRDSMRMVPSGDALLVLFQASVNADSLPELYLMIDGECPLTAVYPKNTYPTALGTDINFAVTPGTHTIGVVTSPRGHGLLDCAGKTPGQTNSINVSAGQRYVILVYGLPSDGFKMVMAVMPTP